MVRKERDEKRGVENGLVISNISMTIYYSEYMVYVK